MKQSRLLITRVDLSNIVKFVEVSGLRHRIVVTATLVLKAKSWKLLREAAYTIDYMLARSTIPEEVCIELHFRKNGKPIASNRI
jgi:hypothetical protein